MLLTRTPVGVGAFPPRIPKSVSRELVPITPRGKVEKARQRHREGTV